MPAIQIRCPGDYNMWPFHIHMLSSCQQPDQNSDPNISQISEARMMNVMLRPPTVTGSNLCDKCDEVWVRMIIWSIHHPEWVTGASLVSAMESLKGGASFQLWPPTSSLVSSLGARSSDLGRWLICEWWWCDCDVVFSDSEGLGNHVIFTFVPPPSVIMIITDPRWRWSYGEEEL